MYDLTITDDTGTETFANPEVPLTRETIEGATDIETLDVNVYTDFFALKGRIERTWAYMSAAEYALLKGFYERQFTTGKYPLITIEGLGIEDLPARMTLSPTEIIDNCGYVQNVTATFRESAQNSSWDVS